MQHGTSLLLLSILLSGLAQAQAHWSLEGSFALGRIVRHTPSFAFSIPSRSTGFLLNLQHQTTGKKSWHHQQKYPRLGIAAGLFMPGSSALGNIWSLSPNLSIDLHRTPKSSLQFQLQAGLAWVTKPFDRLTRPRNNATGSHLNNMTAFQFIWLCELSTKIDATLGFQMVHFSNAGSRLPNFGYNIPMLTGGVRMHLAERLQNLDPGTPLSKDYPKPWGVQAFGYLGWREVAAIGGSRFPVSGLSLGAHYQTTSGNRFLAGIEFELQQAVQSLGLHMQVFENMREARWASSRLMLFAGHEFLFGPLSIHLAAGVYAGSFSWLLPFPVYSRLGLRYYLPPFKVMGPQIHGGIYLKAHRTVAEYFAFGLGCTF